MKKRLVLMLSLMLVLVAGTAMAGTGGTEFTAIYDMIVGWSQGGLGKVVAITAFLIGMVMGITQQSLMAIAIGLGTALAVTYTPDIIDTVFTGVM